MTQNRVEYMISIYLRLVSHCQSMAEEWKGALWKWSGNSDSQIIAVLDVATAELGGTCSLNVCGGVRG